MQFWCFLVRFSGHSALCCAPPVCPASPPLLPFSSAKRTESASPGLHPECSSKPGQVSRPRGLQTRSAFGRDTLAPGGTFFPGRQCLQMCQIWSWLPAQYIFLALPTCSLSSPVLLLSPYSYIPRCILSTPRHFPTMFAVLIHFPTSWALLLHFLLYAQIFLLCQRLCRFLCGHFSRSCCSIAGVVAVTLCPTCVKEARGQGMLESFSSLDVAPILSHFPTFRPEKFNFSPSPPFFEA